MFEKMDKIANCAIIITKGLYPKEIHVDMVATLTDNALLYSTVKYTGNIDKIHDIIIAD